MLIEGDGNLINCINNGDIFANISASDESYIGGISGYNNGAGIQESINNGKIDAKSISDLYVGGVTGYNDSWETSIASIKNSINSGDIYGTSENGKCYIGGISGYDKELTELVDSENLGIVKGEAKDEGSLFENN